MMAGTMVALQRQGIDPASLAMVGHNCSIEGYNNIEAGLQYGTVLQSPIEDADLAAKAAVAILDGKKVENVQYLIPRPVTRANLDICDAGCRKGRNTMSAWTIDLPDTVVVTGTASGLGQEVARQLLDCKVNVIGVDLAEPDSSAERLLHPRRRQRQRRRHLAHRARPASTPRRARVSSAQPRCWRWAPCSTKPPTSGARAGKSTSWATCWRCAHCSR